MKSRSYLIYSLLILLLVGVALFGWPASGESVGGLPPMPSVNIAVEPEVDGKVAYAPIVQGTSNNSGSPDGAHLALKLLVTNQGANTLHLKTTTVSFAGPPFAASAVFNTDMQIASGKTAEVELQNNVAVPGKNFNFMLSQPPPPLVVMKLKFDGYAEPVSLSRPLAPYQDAAPQGAYLFPGRAEDLKPGEFWAGRSNGITALHGGDQRFAYDLGVGRWDETLNDWTDKHPGKDGSHNSDYLVWEKPIYAGASGVIDSIIRDKPDHEPGGENVYGGNKIVIRVGDELIGYFHLRQYSIPANLKAGDAITAGDFIGKVGDSGAASHPHMHTHECKKPKNAVQCHLRPMLFRKIKLVNRSQLNPKNFAGAPWVTLYKGGSLPWVDIAIWPAVSEPGTYRK